MVIYRLHDKKSYYPPGKNLFSFFISKHPFTLSDPSTVKTQEESKYPYPHLNSSRHLHIHHDQLAVIFIIRTIHYHNINLNVTNNANPSNSQRPLRVYNQNFIWEPASVVSDNSSSPHHVLHSGINYFNYNSVIMKIVRIRNTSEFVDQCFSTKPALCVSLSILSVRVCRTRHQLCPGSTSRQHLHPTPKPC